MSVSTYKSCKKIQTLWNLWQVIAKLAITDYQDGEDKGSDRLQSKVAILCWHHIPRCHQPFERGSLWWIQIADRVFVILCLLVFFYATAGMIRSVWPCHEEIGLQQNTQNDVQLQAMYLWHIILGALADDMMHYRVNGHVTNHKICNKKKQELHQCIKSSALLVLLIISDNQND